MKPDLSLTIATLQPLAREELSARWSATFHKSPPPNLSAHLLRGGLIYAMQARQYGELSGHAAAELERAASAPAPAARGPRKGAQLVREWNGVVHIVHVVDDGYIYRDKTYRSLTAIALEITGARWSGPRFFGLKQRTTK